MLIQTYKENQGVIDENIPGFSNIDGIHFAEGCHNTYKPLADSIVAKYPNAKSVLELGSGAGSLAYWMRQANPELLVITVDGNRRTADSPYIKLDNHFILRTDEPFSIEDENGPVSFDLIVSFEHLEHISPELFDVFLENIDRHGPQATIIGTAANWAYTAAHIASLAPGTNPLVHCNVKNQQEWIQYLTEKGYSAKPSDIINNSNKPFNIGIETTSVLEFRKAIANNENSSNG